MRALKVWKLVISLVVFVYWFFFKIEKATSCNVKTFTRSLKAYIMTHKSPASSSPPGPHLLSEVLSVNSSGCVWLCVSPLPPALCELRADARCSHVPLLCLVHDAAITTGTRVLIVSLASVSVACTSSTAPASKMLLFEKSG